MSGWRPWLMWTPPAFLFLFGFFHRGAPGVIAKELMQAFEGTGALVGLLSATYFYAYAGLMVPAGLLIDAYGVRRVVSAGGAVMGLGTLLMGVAPSQPLLFAGRFVVGLGATVTFTGSLKVAATWFPASRFGFLAAITATVGVLGALVSTAPLAALVARVGWRAAFVAVGLTTLAGAMVTALVVRDRPAAEANAATSLRAVLAGALQVLRNPHTWPPFVAFFCLYSAAGNLYLWVVPYLRDVYGLTLTEAATYAMALSAPLLVTAPLTGFLSDQVLRRRKAPYVGLCSALFVAWLAFVLTLGALPLWGVYLTFTTIGVFSGAFVLTWPIGREVNPPHLAGVAVAIVNLGGFLGAALTQGPLGGVLDARWAGAMTAGARAYPVEAYRVAFGVCAALVLGSALVSLLLRETRGRNVYAEIQEAR